MRSSCKLKFERRKHFHSIKQLLITLNLEYFMIQTKLRYLKSNLQSRSSLLPSYCRLSFKGRLTAMHSGICQLSCYPKWTVYCPRRISCLTNSVIQAYSIDSYFNLNAIYAISALHLHNNAQHLDKQRRNKNRKSILLHTV